MTARTESAPSAPPPNDPPANPRPRAGLLQSGVARFVLRLVVTVALLVVLFRQVPLSQVAELFGRARADLVILSGLLFAVSLLGSAYQWWLFLKSQRIEIPFRKALDFYLVGLFFNNFLPANVGGDVMKVIDVNRSGGSKAGALTATVMDRAMGLLVLVLAATAAAWAAGSSAPFPEMRVPLVVLSAGLAMVFMTVLSRRVLRQVARLVAIVPGTRLRSHAARLISHLEMLQVDRRIFGITFVVSVVTQALRIAVHYLAAEALGVHVAPLLFVLLVPAIAVAITLPISIGGFGVREGLGVVLFGRVGVGAPEAFAFELLSHLVAVLVSAWGGIVFALRGRSRR
ncbi:MAG: lysylphosphatidylglycerol synthase transmembrane domain-containing protein [bacterium]